tara:strand:- start:3116 stop:3379 length:264 start_codon:yes stop_codon:yes gene_type:complete
MNKYVNGVLTPLTAVEIAELETSLGVLESNRLANKARIERDSLLAETDYLALSDNTMSAAMIAYRQALRDITDQTGFPTSVTWPTKP